MALADRLMRWIASMSLQGRTCSVSARVVTKRSSRTASPTGKCGHTPAITVSKWSPCTISLTNSTDSKQTRNHSNPETTKNMTLKPGRYRHYKGSDYQVIDVARHSETEELLVVYRTLYGEYDLWVRPLEMFTEEVVVDGKTLPRFTFISEDV